jgi:uncharacterized protein YigA (DUF484 family)
MTATTGTNAQEESAANQGDAVAEAKAPSVTDAALDSNAVAAWLKQHPDFFVEHGELLLDLRIPHESGKAISLLERQVTVYRKRQESMESQFHEIIDNARANDELFEITRMVLLDLLRCTNLLSLKACIEDKLKDDFNASASQLVFISEKNLPQDSILKCLPSTAVRTALGELYQKQRTWCGPLNAVQQELLFAGSDKPIVSAAIVPLHLPELSPIRERYGQPLLLVGSTEVQHFNSSLDTLFLDFIGEVLAVHLHNLALRD